MTPVLPQAAAVLLAAGASSRMGRPKPLLDFEGETFLDRQIHLYAGVCKPVIAVLGHSASEIASGLRRADQATLVLNPQPERGQLSSLQCGLRALPACDAVFFLPIDSPGVRPGTLAELLRAMHAAPEHDFVIPRHVGRRGHPVLMRAAVVEEFLALNVSASARDVVHAHRDSTLYVDVDDPAIHFDIDDPAAYQALLEGARS
ncbi:nucleotidyltransferase family protein [uncultured Paludibaculum sp.]|uniref:nucleotidyltransferase family protein n=1 Tax=uncultured Paludibaculum sp. TaxID=1765020 RepID=UPI002AAC40B1|nr:nucleotidyltransferase family protein [uncultured Paludibaculum sp.]